ncbi:hypothetical protein OE88DRAFT_1645425 [Heliocybe sulcata]|uniref:Uncharacterized protein n=1 Tax=Heliocybe sulcata TaxID=5364 RepID=A0A5C3MZZ6_9AGAM|nr:hypothetical protein OE88DRAFT_1645425 [Heliocybe sulcata]
MWDRIRNCICGEERRSLGGVYRDLVRLFATVIQFCLACGKAPVTLGIAEARTPDSHCSGSAPANIISHDQHVDVERRTAKPSRPSDSSNPAHLHRRLPCLGKPELAEQDQVLITLWARCTTTALVRLDRAWSHSQGISSFRLFLTSDADSSATREEGPHGIDPDLMERQSEFQSLGPAGTVNSSLLA